MVRLPLTPDEIERGRRLGLLIRTARGERPMLRTALDAGISPETLRKIETGRVATPAFSTIAAVAAVVGVSLDELWSELTSEGLSEGLAADGLSAADLGGTSAREPRRTA